MDKKQDFKSLFQTIQENSIYKVLQKRYNIDNGLFYTYIQGNVCQDLGIKPSDINDYQLLKGQFQQMSNNNSITKQKLISLEICMSQTLKKQIKANGEYNIIITEQYPDLCQWIPCYIIIKDDLMLLNILYSVAGESLFTEIYDGQRSLVYLASKFQRIQLLEFLLSQGIDPNVQQSTGSTALHVSSFYGYVDGVDILLKFGADISIQNNSHSVALDEGLTPLVKEIFTRNIHPITKFIKELRDLVKIQEKGLRHKFLKSQILKLEGGNQFIGWYIQNPFSTGVSSYNYNTECFHGTKLQYVSSILQNGLKVPGEITKDGLEIQIQKGHIEQNVTVSGIFNFAKAIFVSPSPFYSTDPIYSERVQTPDGKQYCVLLKCFAMHNSYQIHEATTSPQYTTKDGEDYNGIEWRIPRSDFLMVEGVYFIDESIVTKSMSLTDIKSILHTNQITFKEIRMAEIVKALGLKQKLQENDQITILFTYLGSKINMPNQIKKRFEKSITCSELISFCNLYFGGNYIVKIDQQTLEECSDLIVDRFGQKNIFIVKVFSYVLGG